MPTRIDLESPVTLRREVEAARARLFRARRSRPEPLDLALRQGRVIIQWRQLLIAGYVDRRPNERTVTTTSALVPPPGAEVTLRVPGYDGQFHGDEETWIVVGIDEVEGSVKRERQIHVRRGSFLAKTA